MASSRQRVTARSRQRLYPEPAAVIITVYRPLDSRCVRGIGSCGEWKRRIVGGTSLANVGAALTSSARGWATATSRGSPFLQQELGRLDDRLGVKAGAHRAVVERVGDRDQGHALMVRHIGADDRHLSRPQEDATACSPAPHTSRYRPRPPAAASREKFRAAASGSTIAASAVA